MTEPVIDARLDEIDGLAAAATPGPWGLDPEGALGPHTIVAEHHGYQRMVGAFDTGSGDEAEADRAFVLAARTAVPAMAAEIRALRPLLGEAAAEIEWLVNKLSEHASYEDAEADAWDLVARLRARLAAKEA